MVLPELRSLSLISIGQLCDDNCKVLLITKKLYAIKEVDIILEGNRNLNDGLWDIPIQERTITSANYIKSDIHMSLYPATYIKPSTNAVTFKPSSRVKSHKFPKEFQVFNSLIDSNICGQTIDQQLRKYYKTYTPISVSRKNLSLAIIIRKK